ncbi:hypothetical protein JHD48_09685 [Sulfurimonas sp. SAG-AH-194-I05]|nr:hypothetical protein [Sulfurimonas sp. SAG-AH-194-I05]MDF1876006.1 hypothetical protein [Sulfurimonas sp. SAG-AH-194-I05]
MKSNIEIDGLLSTACDMLKYPDCYEELPRIAMVRSIEIIYKRIMKIDSEILEADITQREYEENFEKTFSDYSDYDLTKIINAIKNDYTKVQEEQDEK